MSDNFSGQNNAKLSNSVESLEYFQQEINDSDNTSDINSSYDHMYATNNQQNGLTVLPPTPETTCQTPESEVNFLKDFILIHLDLIQQQNDDILNKEKTIYILQQENARLKERVNFMERGSTSESSITILNQSKEEDTTSESLIEDMTQGVGHIQEDTKENIVSLPQEEYQYIEEIIEVDEEDSVELSETQIDLQTECLNPNIAVTEKLTPIVEIKEEVIESQVETCITFENTETEYSNCQNSEINYSNASYTIHTNAFDSSDPMKNLKMSIRRKRLCSNSSIFSNNDSLSDEKRNYRKTRKKRKRSVVKNDQILTHNEQYVTQVGEQTSDILRRQELAEEAARAASTSSLEVPHWRVKVYTSCYSMEGTENLEDEVFHRRHSRLENDERRRKRWDVQRIREQRIIDKLKQRQDKNSSTIRTDEQPALLETLWPSIDDVKYIEMCDTLPVSAFGCPVPRMQPCEFSLPWLTTQNNSMKKPPSKKATGRRRGSKR